MADAPDGIVLTRHRDFSGRGHTPWERWVILAVILVIPALALVNVFGQRPGTVVRDASQASLELYAPAHVRSGLLWQARFTIRAHQDVGKAVLVLHSGWFESMTANTIEPSPVEETSVDGSPAFTLGPIAAGDSFTLWLQFQVNPTNVGRRPQTVVLYDGDRRILTLDRTISVFP
ncbi:MAG TPA: hypothetical protein VH306_06255 [Gaiellaceae bacterium]|jgi:hypothetical protein